ncbi:PRC-barrel domain-containing protein [Coraliomargarita sp. SDUM461004]|uniref:PRC-barrel domain-containing protein n=1 Tax=Thalassobacterium sedimentorum TaxID=3041258 RepID=A0ABU1AK89_9BACT|nr:PRC-barrel domain-containing protein [Coraliomargarita sp. SDUM461004]MDQ8195211.1 PRC-barrel domain-containing protein [Coraliomargarita sp. SDUM461004]
MYQKIITFASVLAVTSIGFAETPDLGADFKLTTSDRIQNKVTVSGLTGASVVDKYGETIASIKDLEIDPTSGEVFTAYLEVGGVMGIGSQYIAIPYTQLTYDQAKARYSMKVSRSQIQAHMNEQERSMEAHQDMHSQINHEDVHDEKSSFAIMWERVKGSLGVNEDELAEVQADVRGNILYLEGRVSDEAVKKDIGTAFEASTELKVVNNIKVSQ